jgi:hypothetical protein
MAWSVDRPVSKDFNSILDALEQKLGGARTLSVVTAAWIGFEEAFTPFENSVNSVAIPAPALGLSGVGTHALGATSQTTLWRRLSQHHILGDFP